MPKLSCRELGGDCDYIARGETADEVKHKFLTHQAKTHRVRFEKMSQDERDAMDIRIEQVLRER